MSGWIEQAVLALGQEYTDGSLQNNEAQFCQKCSCVRGGSYGFPVGCKYSSVAKSLVFQKLILEVSAVV